MATHVRFDSTGRTDGRGVVGSDEPQLRELLKQLATEGADLMRGEVALAKLEMRDMAREVALDSARLMAALGLAMLGAGALLAAMVIGIGHLIGDRFGLAALITGVILLGIGGLLAKSAMSGFRKDVRPGDVTKSLKRDKEWASAEIRDLREGIKA